MKIFLSSLEVEGDRQRLLGEIKKTGLLAGEPVLWNLMSYHKLRQKTSTGELIRDASRGVMIDSGAFTLQRNSSNTSFEEYTHEYARFIKDFDRDNVVGYFEMDIDNIVGYDEVLRLRKILLEECGHPEKIIPVWHKNRGVKEFKNTCAEFSGGIVAFSAAKDEISASDFPMFIKEAWKHDCRVHGLGMTKAAILDSVPFDFVDSSSWVHSALFGRLGTRRFKKETRREDAVYTSYLLWRKQQLKYFNRWKRINKDPF